MRFLAPVLIVLALHGTRMQAESGYDAWLRYQPIPTLAAGKVFTRPTDGGKTAALDYVEIR